MPGSDIERSGFFNAQLSDGKYDREYEAEDFSKYFELFFGDGVFVNPADQLMVSASSGLNISIKAGNAFIKGHYYELLEDTTMTISASSSPRRVDVCLVLNMIDRTITRQLLVTQGSGSSIPALSAPINTGNARWLKLATIPIPAGTSTITNSMITDLRPNEVYCGYVKGSIEEISTGNLFQQFTYEFNTWFNQMKGQLSTDVAGNLQTQINELEQKVEEGLEDVKTQIFGNTAVVRSDVTSSGGAYVSSSLNMPDGFTSENCYVKSCMAKMVSGTGFNHNWVYGAQVNNLYTVGCSLRNDNTIYVMLQGAYNGIKGNLKLMVVLEKVEE